MAFRIPIEKHQFVAVLIFAGVSAYIAIRDGAENEAMGRVIVLFFFLMLIFLYRVVAFFASFGFMEYFASDYGSSNPAGPYAFFFWLLFLIACLFQLFKWSIY